MALKFSIGLDAISSYRRLSYTPWHALAEFVDNSTQAFFDNKDILNQAYAEELDLLEVSIVYDRDADVIQISDNSLGMDEDTLRRALHVAERPPNPNGRSRYGMGMKTAACWLGDVWTIRTKRLGDTREYHVTIDVDKIAAGDGSLDQTVRDNLPQDKHYTIIEITRLRKKFHGRTLGKIRDFLSSMYREDFRRGILRLLWRGEQLTWTGYSTKLLKAPDGTIYQKELDFNVDGKRVFGWVGVLAEGSRSSAGFSILHSDRVVKGWPDSWRPSSIFGQIQGSNDLINQRLVGEVHLDDFEVSHTKDDIDWCGDEEEYVEDKLLDECNDYREVAKEYRKNRQDQRGPTVLETQTAIQELVEELSSSAVVDAVELAIVPEPKAIEQAFASVVQHATSRPETFTVHIEGISVRLFLSSDGSVYDPYFVCDSTSATNVAVVVNQAHPHWAQLAGAEGVLNFLRHCVYDALSEHVARRRRGVVEPNTIKLLKDQFLRLPLAIATPAGPNP